MSLNLRIWIFLLLMPCAASAAQLPPLTLPDGVGINIHFTRGHEHELDMIAGLGVKFVRMDLKWEDTERLKGVYDWSAYDELTNNLAKRGIRAYYILGYSNPIYENTTPKFWQGIWPYEELMSPQRPSSVAAFARWAAAAAVHFSKQQPIWEIWNEPNMRYWRPAPNVTQYTQLALATCSAIHQANPDATVVGPTTSGFPWEFLDAFFRSGVLGCLDAVSVHPYRTAFVAPETALGEYKGMRKLIDQYAPVGKRGLIPILSGEWGYSTRINGTSEQNQANYLARMQLFNLMNNVPISIWYDWIDDGSYAYEIEYNYGVVYPDLQPKPAYFALSTLTHTLAGYHLSRRLLLESPWDFALLFENTAGARIIAAWTLSIPHQITLNDLSPPLSAQPTVVNVIGKSIALQTYGSQIKLQLESGPQYLRLDTPAPENAH